MIHIVSYGSRSHKSFKEDYIDFVKATKITCNFYSNIFVKLFLFVIVLGYKLMSD